MIVQRRPVENGKGEIILLHGRYSNKLANMFLGYEWSTAYKQPSGRIINVHGFPYKAAAVNSYRRRGIR